MRKLISIIVGIILLGGFLSANAYESSFYANNSILSSGKWVKIKVKNDGVHQITYEKLKEWGFNNPSDIKIFGSGGRALPTILNSTQYDDLQQIPISFYNDKKVLFYGLGGRRLYITSLSSGNPRYVSEVNPYSEYGYYFITDNSSLPQKLVTSVTNEETGAYDVSYSLSPAYFEEEKISLGKTGKMFFGESMLGSLSTTMQIQTPDAVQNSNVNACVGVCLNSSDGGSLAASINGETIPFVSSTATIRANSNVYVYYNYISPNRDFTLQNIPNESTLKVDINASGQVIAANFDYFIMTYKRYNILSPSIPQMPVGLYMFGEMDRLAVTSDKVGNCIWEVEDPMNPVDYKMTDNVDGDVVKSTLSFLSSFTWKSLQAFNPSYDLMEPELVGDVNNQNIHAMQVPDMLIITTPALLTQANRLADVHRQVDGMDVLVLTQDLIFNEFSSGAPDPTAFRKLCKMFWDKDSQKFTHLLLFGTGSYDNRNVAGGQTDYTLVTYQSPESRDETISYVTDDYFGFLDDNAVFNVTAEKSRLSIGRMTASSQQEAKILVDKVISYIDNNDYSDWRNRILIAADLGDDNLHVTQAEGINALVSNTFGSEMHISKVFCDAYALNGTESVSARSKFTQMLTEGQALGIYIGHGDPLRLTKTAQLWRLTDVNNTKYKNLPIFSFATCDVARFDSGTKGIAELMYHKPDGGVIACMASSRSVYANENDALNRLFLNGLFTQKDDGTYRTVGEAFRDAKIAMTSNSINKLNFVILGDPALKLKYPKTGISVATINGKSIDEAIVTPMTEMTIVGNVKKADGAIDTQYSGKVCGTLWEAPYFYKDLTSGYGDNVINYHSTIENNDIALGNGEVKDGQFTIKMIVPKSLVPTSEKITLSLYAANDENEELVNGLFKVTTGDYDETVAIVDDNAPQIDEFYMNGTEFNEGDVVHSKSVIYAKVSDDVALNVKTSGVGTELILSVDDKNLYSDIKSFITFNDDATEGTINYPIQDLSLGLHTATLYVSDASGNRTQRTISFYVEPATSLATLDVVETPAIDKATFNLNHKFSSATPNVTIKVNDVNGKLVWSTTTASFPYEWNLKDNNGNQVAPGVYNFSSIIDAGTQYGHTETKKIIVIEQ